MASEFCATGRPSTRRFQTLLAGNIGHADRARGAIGFGVGRGVGDAVAAGLGEGVAWAAVDVGVGVGCGVGVGDATERDGLGPGVTRLGLAVTATPAVGDGSPRGAAATSGARPELWGGGAPSAPAPTRTPATRRTAHRITRGRLIGRC